MWNLKVLGSVGCWSLMMRRKWSDHRWNIYLLEKLAMSRNCNIGGSKKPLAHLWNRVVKGNVHEGDLLARNFIYLYECHGKSRSLSNAYYACQPHRYLLTVVSIACNERPNFLLSVTRLKKEYFEDRSRNLMTFATWEPRNLASPIIIRFRESFERLITYFLPPWMNVTRENSTTAVEKRLTRE